MELRETSRQQLRQPLSVALSSLLKVKPSKPSIKQLKKMNNITKSVEAMRTNFSGINIDEDFYGGLFGNGLLNWAMFVTYILGLFGCFGLGLISWFEKSGQAGPYRTVLNQLMSILIDLGIGLYVLGAGLDNIRLVTGPLPSFACHFGFFVKFLIAMFGIIVMVGYTVLKFYMIVIRKSMPVMDDNFITVVVTSNAFVISFFATIAKGMLDGPSKLSYQICSGEWKTHEPQDSGHPIGAIIAVLGISISICLTVAIWIKESRQTIVIPFNHQANAITKLDGNVSMVASFALLSIGAVIRLAMMRTPEEDLNSWPLMLLVHSSNTILPSLGVTAMCLVQYLSNKHMRKTIKRLFVPDQLIPINEE